MADPTPIVDRPRPRRLPADRAAPGAGRAHRRPGRPLHRRRPRRGRPGAPARDRPGDDLPDARGPRGPRRRRAARPARPASTPTSAASRPTTTTSSARAAAGPTEIDDAGLRAVVARRSPAGPATGSTPTASSCSACARPAWPSAAEPAARLSTDLTPDTRRSRPHDADGDPHRDSVSASSGGSCSPAILLDRRRVRRSGVRPRRRSRRARSRSWRRRPSSPTSSGTSAATGSRSTRSSRPAPARRTTSRSRTTPGSSPTPDLIVSNGVGLDDFLDGLLDAAGEGDVRRLVLGDGIPTDHRRRRAEPALLARPEPRRRPLPAGDRGRACPRSIRPARRPTRRTRAAYADASRRAGRRATRRRSTTIPAANRKLVTFHDAFPYFARALRLRAGRRHPRERRPGADGRPSWPTLVETVKAAGVKAVFSEAQFSPELAQTLADEAGITKVVTTLYNDALGPAAGRHLPRDDGAGTSTRSWRRSMSAAMSVSPARRTGATPASAGSAATAVRLTA